MNMNRITMLFLMMLTLSSCGRAAPAADTSVIATAISSPTPIAPMPVPPTASPSTPVATSLPTTVAPSPSVATKIPAPLPSAKEKDVSVVELKTEDGVRIKGTYYRPAATHTPGIVLLHMLGRNRNDWAAFAGKLQDAGYGVIAIDLRGHGDSGGKREWAKMVRDAAVATEFLRQQSEIDPHRILIVGASIGANVAINYAAHDATISGVALLSPGLDYRGVKTEEAVREYAARSLFIAASQEDSYAAQSSQKLAALAQGPHTLLILKNQGHGTQMLGKENGLEEALFQWFAEVAKQ